MQTIRISAISAAALIICSIVLSGCCSNGNSAAEETASVSGTVIDNIMTRRSIRQYKPQAVGRDTMQIILNCGINAPNGQNKQSWEVRVVDNPEYIAGITAAYVKEPFSLVNGHRLLLSRRTCTVHEHQPCRCGFRQETRFLRRL